MTLLEADWERIKLQFDKNETLHLMIARCGQSVLPRAWLIDTSRMAPDLVLRIKQEVDKLHANPTTQETGHQEAPIPTVQEAGDAPPTDQGAVHKPRRPKV